MSKINVENLLIESATKYAEKANGRSSLSVGIAYSDNVTRMTISNNLCSKLNLDDELYVGVAVKEKSIILSKNNIANMEKFKISKKNNTIYNKALIEGIVKSLNLISHFKQHTSISFHQINIDEEKNIAVVIAELSNNQEKKL